MSENEAELCLFCVLCFLCCLYVLPASCSFSVVLCLLLLRIVGAAVAAVAFARSVGLLFAQSTSKCISQIGALT